MKKSLVALAVLAASGAAMAQSSVTLYGIADVWVGSVEVDNGTTSTSTTTMVSGGVSTSRWGMKGSEDLGGGLKAEFTFEQAVNVDDGAAAGFTRHAWVGLAGGFGAVRMGKTSTPYDDFGASSDAAFDSDLAPMNLGGFASTKYVGKTSNTIKYVSPTMSGFTGAVSYALDEDVATAASVTSLGLSYAAGPLAAQVVYQSEDMSSKADEQTFFRVGASYNFGMATVKGIVAKVSDFGYASGADVDEFQIGLDFPISANLVLSGSYANADYNTQAGGKEVGGFGVALAYIMSKRTTLYGGFGMVTTDYDAATPDVDVTAIAVGVKHTF